MRKTRKPFKPRARMLVHLGEQLIRDAGIAVFELVKNSYDADATEVSVDLQNVENADTGTIVISDNGTGMTWEIVTEIWMEPGTDHREIQKKKGKRTKLGRLPLGEKGIGRFAAHKLGHHIELVTRSKDKPEVVVKIDWEKFLGKEYLSETKVSISERKPRVFKGGDTGTRITVSKLKEEWARGMVRNLHRAVTSICSPFRGPEGFTTSFSVTPNEDWLENLLDLQTVMEFAPFQAQAIISRDGIDYDYAFVPPVGMKGVNARSVKGKRVADAGHELWSQEARKTIGDCLFEIKIFDFDAQVLEFLQTDRKGLRDFMRQNGGIRVFRDGVRIFDYGEPGNDWLQLGTRRVNIPTKRVSNNLLIGAVHLDGASSPGLIEKTNREGFVENQAASEFRQMVAFGLIQIEHERNFDKKRIRKEYSSKKLKEPVLDEIERLRRELAKHKLEETLGGLVDNIEKQFRDVRETLMTAAGPGLTLSVVVHEVEKGIGSIISAITRKADMEELTELATHLGELVEGLTYLTRRSGNKKERASNLIKQALFNTNYRLRAHDIKGFPGTSTGDPDFSVKCTRRMIIATLINLIDNSIYWLVNKGAKNKRIYIGTSTDLQGGPAIIVADNGPGFSDPTDYLVEPFITRRPEGMGLGLHIASEVMKAHGGKLVFPEKGDIDLPKGFNGAVVALHFVGEDS